MITNKHTHQVTTEVISQKFNDTINEFRGICYNTEDFDAVHNQKNEFNSFFKKTPPKFNLTENQIKAGVSEETKIFIMKILYLLPNDIRFKFVSDDVLTNKIIDLYTSQFKILPSVNNLTNEELKDILYFTWFFYRLQDRQTKPGLCISKSSIFGLAVKRAMECIIPATTDSKQSELLSQAYVVIKSFVEPVDNLNGFAKILLPLLKVKNEPSEVYNVAKDISDHVGPPKGLHVKTEESFNKLAKLGFTLDQLEIVARYTWGRQSMKCNSLYFNVEQMAETLSTFAELAMENNWKTKEVPNLDNGEFEKLVSVLFVAVDPHGILETPDFIGSFVAYCYSVLLANENGDGVLEEPEFTTFIGYAINLFTTVTELSFDPENGFITPTQPANKEINKETENIQSTPESNQNSEIENTVISTITKDSKMNNVNTTATPTITPVLTELEKAYQVIHEDMKKANQNSTMNDLIKQEENNHSKEMASYLEKVKKQTEDRNKKVDEAFEVLQSRVDVLDKKQKQTEQRFSELEKKVFGDEATPILDRIREKARESEYHYSTSSSSSSSDLSTVETIAVTTVAVVGVSAIGYSIYRLLNDE